MNNRQNIGKDVVINSIITDDNTGKIISGINLRTLKEMKGKASYSAIWNNTNLEPGNYKIVIELRDTQGVLLDQKIEYVRLGIFSGEIISFNVEPESFQIGDNIKINMIFNNTGNTNISGTAKIKIFDSEGHVIDEFEHKITELSPSKPIEFIYEWETSKAEDSIYKIVGYVMYDGDTTIPVIEHVYLPSFEVSGLSIKPDKVKIGESVIITVECKNTGATRGFHTITLRIDGSVEHEETIALNPDESTTVSFEVSADQEGTFTVDVNDLAGSFMVEKAQTGIPGFTYETTIFGMILGLLLYWLLRARLTPSKGEAAPLPSELRPLRILPSGSRRPSSRPRHGAAPSPSPS